MLEGETHTRLSREPSRDSLSWKCFVRFMLRREREVEQGRRTKSSLRFFSRNFFHNFSLFSKIVWLFHEKARTRKKASIKLKVSPLSYTQVKFRALTNGNESHIVEIEIEFIVVGHSRKAHTEQPQQQRLFRRGRWWGRRIWKQRRGKLLKRFAQYFIITVHSISSRALFVLMREWRSLVSDKRAFQEQQQQQPTPPMSLVMSASECSIYHLTSSLLLQYFITQFLFSLLPSPPPHQAFPPTQATFRSLSTSCFVLLLSCVDSILTWNAITRYKFWNFFFRSLSPRFFNCRFTMH